MVTHARRPARRRGEIRNISLVLGSGAARGLTHIGVIEALERRGFRIRSIVGCSMGALIGGIHAMGKLDVYRDWVCALERVDVLRLMDPSLTASGLLRGQKIIDVLRESIGDTDIEELPIKYTAVATDLQAQKEVWIEQGSLFDAIRASIAIPTVFTPYRLGDRLLLDGGLLNPIPVTPTLRDDTDLVVAVDLSGPPDSEIQGRLRALAQARDGELDKYRNAIRRFLDDAIERLAGALQPDESDDELGLREIVMGSFELMQATIARHQLASNPPDLLITVPRNICQSFDFHKAAPLIAIGRELAEEALSHLPAPRASE
ncbi:MAG: serine protease [Gammaproteobacteria bacterium]|nr:MAG: serine protease [Gammaproteobacteria bacterium]